MAALLTAALIALTGFAAMGVLADSGLRWWSAFGRRRRAPEAIRGTVVPARIVVRNSNFGRSSARRPMARSTVSRAAA